MQYRTKATTGMPSVLGIFSKATERGTLKTCRVGSAYCLAVRLPIELKSININAKRAT
jgi:hypothetical protein